MKNLKGSYRTQDGKAQIEWELTEKDGRPVFSASGDYENGCGQNLDEIGKAYPNDAAVQEMVAVWRKYHLNDMKSGTPEQEAEIEQARITAETYARQQPKAEQYFYDGELTQPNWHSLCRLFGFDSYYSWARDILRQANLYQVPIFDEDPRPLAADDVVQCGEIGSKNPYAHSGVCMVAYIDGLPYLQQFKGQVQASSGLPSTASPCPNSLRRVKTETVSTDMGGRVRNVLAYTYGSAWLYAPIPDDVLKQIEGWANLPARRPLHFGVIY